MSLSSMLRKALTGSSRKPPNQENHPREHGFPALEESLEKNISSFKEYLGTSEDVKYHAFSFGRNLEFNGTLLFLDGMVSSDTITQSILKPLISNKEISRKKDDIQSMQDIQKSMLCSGDVVCQKEFAKLLDGLLSGDTIFLLDGFPQGLVISTRNWDKRSVTEPQTESVVRGPREGFTENFRTNTSLMRRRLKSHRLRMEHMVIGEKTSTSVCIVYIEGVAKPEIVKTLRQRLAQVHVDSILDASYLEEYIEDSHFSVFSTVNYTEKPDVAAAKILEGRVGIITDGSPFMLTVPALFIESFQTAEDYYIRPFYASITRLMRFLAYAISIFAVPIYIALTTFHQELIPTTLLITIASAREGTPFPALMEALIMVLSFEILREAGLRLPRPVGQSVSIVGALVMGDAAVSAGLVGAPMVITVAITAVAGFIIPSQIDSITILRIIMMLLASMLGGFGIAVGLLGVLVHLAVLKSFGVPYCGAVIPSRDQQDTFIRLPLWMMIKRPETIAGRDEVRKTGWMPATGKESDGQSENNQ
ncbi:spore germination protein [Oscillospiraceae bacterium MB08-C2-2]|nr:spore germination protein [Oscillospiraceae bacterium MB08-C2-2]